MLRCELGLSVLVSRNFTSLHDSVHEAYREHKLKEMTWTSRLDALAAIKGALPHISDAEIRQALCERHTDLSQTDLAGAFIDQITLDAIAKLPPTNQPPPEIMAKVLIWEQLSQGDQRNRSEWELLNPVATIDDTSTRPASRASDR